MGIGRQPTNLAAPLVEIHWAIGRRMRVKTPASAAEGPATAAPEAPAVSARIVARAEALAPERTVAEEEEIVSAIGKLRVAAPEVLARSAAVARAEAQPAPADRVVRPASEAHAEAGVVVREVAAVEGGGKSPEHR